MTAFTTALAAYLMGSSDPKTHRAGTYVAIASVVPHLVSGIVVPALTPKDAWHSAFHWGPAAMTGAALTLDW